MDREKSPVVTGRRAVEEEDTDPEGTIFLDRLCREMGADYKGSLQRARMNKRGSKLKFDDASGRYTVGPEFAETMKAAKENPEWT
jgi:hypothetical protein